MLKQFLSTGTCIMYIYKNKSDILFLCPFRLKLNVAKPLPPIFNDNSHFYDIHSMVDDKFVKRRKEKTSKRFIETKKSSCFYD